MNPIPALCEFMKQPIMVERWTIFVVCGLIAFCLIKIWIDAATIKRTLVDG